LFLAFFKSDLSVFKRRPQFFTVILGVVYALSDELHQKLVPGRSADIFDFLADCIGVVVVQIILWLYFKSREQKGAKMKLTAPL
jgi:VanZ family protein